MKHTLMCLFVVIMLVAVTSSLGMTTTQVTKEYSAVKEIVDDIASDVLFPYTMEIIYSDTFETHDSLKPTPIETPDSFNWADYQGEDWTTPARDQGNCGSCWCFAAVAVLESAMNIKENCSYLDLDLSEQYVLSCLPKAGSCKGGMAYTALKYIINTSVAGNNCNGIILESCMPYQADDSIPCEAKCPEWRDNLIPFVEFSVWNAEPGDRERIKADLLQKGPVAVSMYVNRDFLQWHIHSHDPNDYFPFQEERYTNHVVLLVGWKDDPHVEQGGYWICKNSWGTGYGYDGFFNIEYGSLHIDDSNVVSTIYDPESFNCPPQVKTNGYYLGEVGETVPFDSRGSFDVDSDISSYHWDLGDGTEKTGATLNHVYQEEGIYPVVLTLTDKHGKIGTDQTWAFIDTVNHPPEKPVIKGPQKFKNFTRVNFTITTSDLDTDYVYYYIDWDEGEKDEWIGPYRAGEEVLVSHYWVFRDTYEIRVKAKDIYGDESDWEILPITVTKSASRYEMFFLRMLTELLSSFHVLYRIVT